MASATANSTKTLNAHWSSEHALREGLSRSPPGSGAPLLLLPTSVLGDVRLHNVVVPGASWAELVPGGRGALRPRLAGYG